MGAEMRKSKSANHPKWIRSLATAARLCPLVIFIACHHEPEFAQGSAHSSMQVMSPSFTNGGEMAQRLTCDGTGLSPALQWSDPPAGTRSIALVMHDPDALLDFTHWIVFNLPPAARSLAEGASEQGSLPQGSAEGMNDFEQKGYGGPCPPGDKPHRYIFHIYALDIRLDLPSDVNRKRLDLAISNHVLAVGEITATYRRRKP
jgi:Raf kinase inhibitor-like YbhB/YbcL family protein